MSFRHTLITQFIYATGEDPQDLHEFINVLESHFGGYGHIHPNFNKYGTLSFISIYASDSDGSGVERELPDLLTNAEGILKGDIDLVAAWEYDNEIPRQRVFTIKGRGQKTIMEFLESKGR
jgi:hypothetical protein